MPNKIEGKYPGECLVSQANGQLTLDTVTLLSGSIYNPCDVLGVVTVSGKATLVAPAANDGSQVAALINYNRVDATAGDVAGTAVIARECEVNGAELGYGAATAPQIAAINTQLAAKNILVRPGR